MKLGKELQYRWDLIHTNFQVDISNGSGTTGSQSCKNIEKNYNSISGIFCDEFKCVRDSIQVPE